MRRLKWLAKAFAVKFELLAKIGTKLRLSCCNNRSRYHRLILNVSISFERINSQAAITRIYQVFELVYVKIWQDYVLSMQK